MVERKTEEEVRSAPEISSAPFSNAGVAVKDGIVASLRGLNEIETELVGVARTAVSGTLGATAAIADEGFNVAKGLLVGVSDVGTAATRSVTDILVGVAGGAKEVLGAILPLPGRRTGYEPSRRETPAEEEEKAAA